MLGCIHFDAERVSLDDVHIRPERISFSLDKVAYRLGVMDTPPVQVKLVLVGNPWIHEVHYLF
jgi:hypothetical protein